MNHPQHHRLVVPLFTIVLAVFTALGVWSSPNDGPEKTENSVVEEPLAAFAGNSEDKQKPAPPRPKLRAGINETQLQNAIDIVVAGQEMNMGKDAYTIAVATAMQESDLRVLANPTYPESYDLPNQGEGQDHDSVGLFQQRPASGWGPVEELMDPKESAKKFYSSLDKVSDWDRMPLTVAAQEVQGSAFPDHYAKHEGKAELVVESILEWQKEKNGK
jgi:hypothetical protein